MTLSPESRVILTDALRPPAGFRVDAAVGTTYTLDLTALLMAPLSFAVADAVDADHVDPIRLLEAVRRHADRTSVFVQAGGIAVPSNYRSILTFVEDSVHQVAPPPHAHLFHPKIWVLRFSDDLGAFLHRVVVLSRNLTFDRSWDTALVLDEDPAGTIDAGPAASFVRALPTLTLRSLAPARRRLIDELSETLARVRLTPPAPFTDGRLVPIGLDDEPVWPFPDTAERMLAISPFLTTNAIAALARISDERTLVSRAESFDLVGRRMLAGWQTRTLQRQAEGEADATDNASGIRTLNPADGLHAKTFVFDLADSRSTTITGSANLTSARWGRSVEFDAVLTGPTKDCGVARALGDDGLAAMLSSYEPISESGEADPAIATVSLIEQFQRSLASARPTLRVETAAENAVTVTLALTSADDPGETRVWPASLPSAQALRLPGTAQWTIAAKNVTPFLAVETTAGTGDARATVRRVIVAELVGDISDRRANALRDVLSTPADVLRYLVFLLGDQSYDHLLSASATAVSGWGEGSVADIHVALFEPLIRAMGRDADVLTRVSSLVDELRSLPDGATLIPESFDVLWDVVWQVHQEMSS